MSEQPKTTNKRCPKRVLVIRLSAMGDVAMTSQALANACRLNPDTHFDVLTTSAFGVFYRPAKNLTILPHNVRRDYSSPYKLLRLWLALRKNNYDAVVDLHDVLRTKILRLFFKLSGCRITVINKGRAEKRDLVSGKNRQQLTPMTRRYRQTLTAAGLNMDFVLELLDPMPLPHSEKLPTEKTDDEVWIGVSPFAQHKGKVYPLDRMKQVVRKLAERPNTRIFVFGGGETEKLLAEQWQTEIPNTTSFIGVANLKEEMALISNLDCMVSMDSSNMHIASLFGVRVVSVWGATHPFAGFLGYGQDESVGLDMSCRPCSVYGNKPCARPNNDGSYPCMDISPSTIVEKVLMQF